MRTFPRIGILLLLASGCGLPAPREASAPLPPWSTGDADAATRMLERGCKGEERDACWRWGVAFLRSDRVPANPSLARDLFESACDAGSMKACRSLFDLLEEGQPSSVEPAPEVLLSADRAR